MFILGVGVTLYHYSCHGDHTISTIISGLIYMIRGVLKTDFGRFQGLQVGYLAHESLSIFIHSLI